VPTVFIVWGLTGLAGRPGPFSMTLFGWFVGALIGAAVSPMLEPAPRIDQSRRSAWQSASVVPLIRNMTMFGAHYLLHVIAGFHPDLAATAMRWDVGVSGFSAGYFVAWAALLIVAWQRTSTDTPPRDRMASSTTI
jgi:hypothetical protein